MNREIIVDKNMLELNPQGDFAFPFNLLHITLSDYPFGRFPCHWHPETEITCILHGQMTYHVNQTSFLLKEKDCIFVNSNSLHAGEQYEGIDCKYVCFVFNPVLVYGFEHGVLDTNFVSPILDDKRFDFALFHNLEPDNLLFCSLVDKLVKLSDEKSECYPLHIKSAICELWSLVYQAYAKFISEARSDLSGVEVKQIQRLKKALLFIYEHYCDPITLDEIAASCHTSKSEFCRLFKKALHQTPFDFLLRYRVEKSLSLLCYNDLSVTEVAVRVGFSGPSYFAETFRKFMRCSPTEYRKRHKMGTQKA